MKRPLQVYVDETELTRFEEWSRQRGWTKSEAVRLALRAMIRTPESDPLLRMSGTVRGLPADLSQQVERYIEETFDARKAPRASRPHRPRARTRR